MSISSKLFAAMYDRFMARSERRGLAAHRDGLLARASGDVLEIGGGTGANLSRYGQDVRSLTIIEPAEPMLRRLQHRIEEQRSDARALRAQAEEIPFEDNSFDMAISTLVLCTVDDQPRALRELTRVLRPGGRLLFMEHVRSDDPRIARWQDRLLGLNTRICGGCHCNRPTLESIRTAGFEVRQVQNDEIPGAPPWVRPLVIGEAELVGELAGT